MTTRTLLPFIALAMAAGVIRCFSAGVEVPPGIVYKTVDEETDAKARKALADAFSAGDSKILQLCTSAIICGPGYWEMIKDDPAITAAHPAASEFKVPVAGTKDMRTFYGALFKDDDARKALAARLAADVGKKPVIRKLHPDELKIFWAFTPYDIQEPIYILEAGANRFLLNLTDQNGKLSITWLDELSHNMLDARKNFQLITVAFYQPDEILKQRLQGGKETGAYLQQLQAVAADFFAADKTPETFHIIVGVRPGKRSRVWFLSSTRAGDSAELAPLRKKLEAIPPVDVHAGPIAFVMSAKIAGGDGKIPPAKDYQPPIPDEWLDATKDSTKSFPVPDGYLDAVWPDKK